MKIYDISQEVFSCKVYPGDPIPKKKKLNSMENGDLYNLTEFSMCAHNGTHIDAPFHFIKDGKTVDAIGMGSFVGMAYAAEHHGVVSGDDAAKIIEKAKKQNPEAAKRILIKGDAEVSPEAAKVFASAGILLLGNESQTVGPENAPMEVHLILLNANVVLLEGIRLAEVSEGVYLLNAAPLNLSGADGSPCRAVLIDVVDKTWHKMIGDIVTVTVDRPLGSYHPEYKDMYYPINYGYIEGIIAPDGEEQDAYILGVNKPVDKFTGKIIAIVHRFNDVEEKWVVCPVKASFNKEEILEQIRFQEQYYQSEIIM